MKPNSTGGDPGNREISLFFLLPVQSQSISQNKHEQTMKQKGKQNLKHKLLIKGLSLLTTSAVSARRPTSPGASKASIETGVNF